MSIPRIARLGIAIVALAACSANPVAPRATVYFVLDAPLCSSRIPVQFLIDNAQVGMDTLTVDVLPEHKTSAGFETSSGTHTLSARVVNGYVWPIKTVSISPGEALLDSLPFYCS